MENHERLKLAGGKHLTVEEHRVVGCHPLHWHSFFELELVLSGAGTCIVNDVAYDIAGHNVFFLTSTDFHYLEAAEETRVLNISFDEALIDGEDLERLVFSRTKKAYAFPPEDYARLRMAAELLRHECSVDGDCQRQLLQYLLRGILRENDAPGSGVPEGSSGIRRAIIYMEMHFREKITLQTLAAEAGYNPTYFSELFKKVCGETCMEMLGKLRVGCARTLLANGYSVSDACFMSGFGSLSNFQTIFRRHCRMSPGEYRAKHRTPPGGRP